MGTLPTSQPWLPWRWAPGAMVGRPGLLLEGQWNTPDLGISLGEPASDEEQVWGKRGCPG